LAGRRPSCACSSYPQGLKGEKHRPYRPALGLDKALEEIERGWGSLYDPLVAAACLRLFREKGFQLSPQG